MLFEYNYKVNVKNIMPNKKMALFMAKKMLPEYIFDTSKLENNPLTFPEVQTLIDGITVGGHKISDVNQVLNIKQAWEYLLKEIKKDTFKVNKETFLEINRIIAIEDALESGVLRSGNVGIAGTTSYTAPKSEELNNIFDNELPVVLSVASDIEKALRLFLWGSLNQFFWDGNKRTSRLIASGILISSGYGVFNIPSKEILTFNTLMIDFYNTRKANDIMKFLNNTCVRYYE